MAEKRFMQSASITCEDPLELRGVQQNVSTDIPWMSRPLSNHISHPQAHIKKLATSFRCLIKTDQTMPPVIMPLDSKSVLRASWAYPCKPTHVLGVGGPWLWNDHLQVSRQVQLGLGDCHSSPLSKSLCLLAKGLQVKPTHYKVYLPEHPRSNLACVVLGVHCSPCQMVGINHGARKQ